MEKTLEQLEEEYRMLLESRLYDLKQKNNLTATSRLERDDRQQSNMMANSNELENFREEFTTAQQRKFGNKIFTGHRTYEEIMKAMVRGEYRK